MSKSKATSFLVTDEEPDMLLAFAVKGACRLVSQRVFTIPPSSKAALRDWIYTADPVLAWLDECVEVPAAGDRPQQISTRSAYEQFSAWAKAEGFMENKLPAINGFVQRVQANLSGIEYKRSSEGRYFLGMVIDRSTSSGENP